MYIADLHIHSSYSRATSRDCTPEYLDLWARRKGIHIVGTGDFTHPAWRAALEEKLSLTQDGFYTLKEEYRIHDGCTTESFEPRFVVTGEISSIYKKNDKVRKVHSVIILPGLEAAEAVSAKLEAIGNIHSDGRPILGLDCRDLLEITLELCPDSIYVPAHIWTPHFSLFGAFSGFDTVEECFEDLTPYIHAMETGLSSDPPMNWRISALDKYQLISNSDAHSPAKLGREANLLDIDLSYDGLYRAIQTGNGLYGTIEFFPEEGKYHFDGHRKCNICLSPADAEKYGGKCPVCGRKLTIGVSHRVEQLADRAEGFVREEAKPFESLVPLPEVIGASTGHAATSAKVVRQYEEMLGKLGPEFEILRNVPEEDIRRVSGSLISRGILRLRKGQVERMPGFDGEYGTIRLFSREELENTDGQISLFDSFSGLFDSAKPSLTDSAAADNEGKALDESINADSSISADASMSTSAVINEDNAINTEDEAFAAATKVCEAEKQVSVRRNRPMSPKAAMPALSSEPALNSKPALNSGSILNSDPALNSRQEEAVTALDRCVAVIAGPGTGKTKTLISRISHLLDVRRVKPSQITAVTFTNKAAAEMKERLSKNRRTRQSLGKMHIGTFHSLCLELLSGFGMTFTLADSALTMDIAEAVVSEYGLNMSAGQFLQKVSYIKSQSTANEEKSARLENTSGKAEFKKAFDTYNERLRQANALDFDDLLLEAIKVCEKEGERPEFNYLLVDEFQDISPVQYELIKVWNRQGRELFVIGDSDQAIYGFRGADSGCFDRLILEFPEAKVIRLVENYRSVPQIINAALSVISNNPGPERFLHSNAKDGLPVRVVRAKSEMAQAIFVAHEINRYIGGIDMLDAQEKDDERGSLKVRGFGDVAVLYRTHRQARLLEEALRREGIPYIVAGRDDFLDEKNVRGSLAFFDWLLNEENTLARQTAMQLLYDYEDNLLSAEISEKMREQFSSLFDQAKPGKFMAAWLEYMGLGEDGSMEKLSKMAVCYKNMKDFMNVIHLGIESDLIRCGTKTYTSDAVRLMTLHGSKGLEFPVTMICGVQKGVLPYENEKYPSDLLEERRLFFVGITRAKEELVITWAGEPSDFVSELPEQMIVREEAGKPGKPEENRQMSLFDLL